MNHWRGNKLTIYDHPAYPDVFRKIQWFAFGERDHLYYCVDFPICVSWSLVFIYISDSLIRSINLQYIPRPRPRWNEPVSSILVANVAMTYSLLYSRVCEVRLLGNHEFTLRQQKYRVSDALKTGEASVLFG